MTELQEQGEMNGNKLMTAMSFTLSLDQIAMLSELQIRLGLKRSEIVRRAIDLLYEQTNGNEKEVTA